MKHQCCGGFSDAQHEIHSKIAEDQFSINSMLIDIIGLGLRDIDELISLPLSLKFMLYTWK